MPNEEFAKGDRVEFIPTSQAGTVVEVNDHPGQIIADGRSYSVEFDDHSRDSMVNGGQLRRAAK